MFSANGEKNTISRQNWTRLHWRALACTFTDSAESFCFKMEPDFPNFSLNLDFQDSENETPNKLIKEMTEKELEKSIDPLYFSRFTRHITVTEKITPDFRTNLGTVKT